MPSCPEYYFRLSIKIPEKRKTAINNPEIKLYR
ncbi:unnamed protein product, partial [marine sediment metagenome]